MKIRNKIIKLLILGSIMMAAGCGEKETNEPTIKLTASAVVSQSDSTAHTHVVNIPFTDVSASPVANIFQYRTDEVNSHSHVIALTKQQMIDINNGMRVVLTSSAPLVGTVHNHSWKIQGGDLLYEKNCYNCHSNDKRSNYPMNVSFSQSQISAVINPSGATLSTSASATPDPNYTTSSATVILDGAVLYASNCSSCHGALATSTKRNKSLTLIKNAISANTGGMSSLGSLTDAQLQAIVTALAN